MKARTFESVTTNHYKMIRDTHTKHTRVLALIPVLEVMLVIRRYCLTFDIRGQAQFWKQSVERLAGEKNEIKTTA